MRIGTTDDRSNGDPVGRDISPELVRRRAEGPGPLTLRQPTYGHGGNARTDEEVTMATTDPPRRDARHCPHCGARGILPLDQPKEPSGAIQDPVMLGRSAAKSSGPRV